MATAAALQQAQDLLAETPRPIQWAIAGGDVTHMDHAGMEKHVAALRETGDICIDLARQAHAAHAALVDATDTIHIIDPSLKFVAGLQDQAALFYSLADQAERTSADDQKNFIESVLFICYAAADLAAYTGSGAEPAAAAELAAKHEEYTVLQKTFLARIIAIGTSATAKRAGFAVLFGFGNSGIDALVQAGQIEHVPGLAHRSRFDTTSIEVMGVQGAAAVLAGHAGGSLLTPHFAPLGRAAFPVAAAAAGVIGTAGGVVGAAAVTGHLDMTVSSVVAGVTQGIAGGVAAQHMAADAPHDIAALPVTAERVPEIIGQFDETSLERRMIRNRLGKPDSSIVGKLETFLDRQTADWNGSGKPATLANQLGRGKLEEILDRSRHPVSVKAVVSELPNQLRTVRVEITGEPSPPDRSRSESLKAAKRWLGERLSKADENSPLFRNKQYRSFVDRISHTPRGIDFASASDHGTRTVYENGRERAISWFEIHERELPADKYLELDYFKRALDRSNIDPINELIKLDSDQLDRIPERRLNEFRERGLIDDNNLMKVGDSVRLMAPLYPDVFKLIQESRDIPGFDLERVLLGDNFEKLSPGDGGYRGDLRTLAAIFKAGDRTVEIIRQGYEAVQMYQVAGDGVLMLMKEEMAANQPHPFPFEADKLIIHERLEEAVAKFEKTPAAHPGDDADAKTYIEGIQRIRPTKQAQLNRIGADIEDAFQGAVYSPRTGPKPMLSIDTKLATDERIRGRPSRVPDYFSGMIRFENPNDALLAADAIARHPGIVEIVRYKNRYITPANTGYMDINVAFRMKPERWTDPVTGRLVDEKKGYLAELQLKVHATAEQERGDHPFRKLESAFRASSAHEAAMRAENANAIEKLKNIFVGMAGRRGTTLSPNQTLFLEYIQNNNRKGYAKIMQDIRTVDPTTSDTE